MIEQDLPSATAPTLHLSHSTPDENTAIWTQQTELWKGPLTTPQFLEECAYIETIPLAREGGMTQWILTDDTTSTPRLVLASCETYKVNALTSDAQGNVSQVTAHGIASVYCNPLYRGKGYASRLMRELAQTLPTWQREEGKPCVASVLFSDIGPVFYAREGWDAFPSYHLEFEPLQHTPSSSASGVRAMSITAEDVPALCALDEEIVRKTLSHPATDKKVRFQIMPDYEHIAWHHHREEFAAEKLGMKRPVIKGAIAGSPGHRVWVLWTHRIYDNTLDGESGNTLYILRLVVEDVNDDRCAPVQALQAVLEAARVEAADWGLPHVKLWDPSEQVEEWIKLTGISYSRVERGMASICSLRWFGDEQGIEEVNWLGKEKYCWC